LEKVFVVIAPDFLLLMRWIWLTRVILRRLAMQFQRVHWNNECIEITTGSSNAVLFRNF
jgi:hypothetical protein